MSSAVGAMLALMVLLAVASASPIAGDKLVLRIVHTNDMHSRFDETSQHSGNCNQRDREAGRCYGGFARIATLVRQARSDSEAQGVPVFFLNAGDTYQGTTLFTHYKWQIVARFLNILQPDVASLGNHEFDDGVEGLIPYLNNASFPVVAANLDLSGEPRLARTNQLQKSAILEANGRKVGVIGYLTSETQMLSAPGAVKFVDEVVAIREEARRLKAQGVDIIVALGHSGYEVDKRIAREVEDVDLVVGGHTNTFLYTGAPPDLEAPEGLYPTEVVQASGRKAYVVQAYAYTKYLGNLTLEIDERGEISKIEGSPILVDSSVPMAPDVEAEVKKWLEPLGNSTAKIIGYTKVYLEGTDIKCRLWECNFGNLVTDAMIYHNLRNFTVDNGWTDAPIAVHQGGGIRTSVGSISSNEVTMNDVLTAFPFGTRLLKVDMTGKAILEMLEWSVHDRISPNSTSHGGGFLQVSGLKVAYDLDQPLNSRVVAVKARCGRCIVPKYHPLEPEQAYRVVLPEFLYQGGDGYTVFKGLKYSSMNATIADVVAEYINMTSPVFSGEEGRIHFVNEDDKSSPNSATATQLSAFIAIFGCVIALQSTISPLNF